MSLGEADKRPFAEPWQSSHVPVMRVPLTARARSPHSWPAVSLLLTADRGAPCSVACGPWMDILYCHNCSTIYTGLLNDISLLLVLNATHSFISSLNQRFYSFVNENSRTIFGPYIYQPFDAIRIRLHYTK